MQSYKNWFERVKGYTQNVRNSLEINKEGLELGYTQPKLVTRGVSAQIGAMLERDLEDHPYFKIFKNVGDVASPEDALALQNEVKEYIQNVLNPAYQELYDFLINEYLPEDEIKKNFTPSYNPWEQRMCLVPNGDFFNSIKENKASVVTDKIQNFTSNSILLESGKKIDADLIVTATGLNLKLLGGIELVVDGKKTDTSQTMTYKSMMFSDIPNFISTFGYINALSLIHI